MAKDKQKNGSKDSDKVQPLVNPEVVMFRLLPKIERMLDAMATAVEKETSDEVSVDKQFEFELASFKLRMLGELDGKVGEYLGLWNDGKTPDDETERRLRRQIEFLQQFVSRY